MSNKTISCTITGNHNLLGDFYLTPEDGGERQEKTARKRADFQVGEGKKYNLYIEILGSNGSKYKLKFENVTEHDFLDEEHELDNEKDIHSGSITA